MRIGIRDYVRTYRPIMGYDAIDSDAVGRVNNEKLANKVFGCGMVSEIGIQERKIGSLSQGG